MKCAIIGASGFIGRSLLQRLGEKGHEVAGYDLMSCDETGVSALDVSKDEMEFARGTDVVVYLSQSPHYRSFPENADDLFGVNVVGAARAAAAAQRSGARLFVYASTGNVYKSSFDALGEGAPLEGGDAYSLSKIMGETAVRAMASEMKTLVIRIFGAFGPGQKNMLIPTLATRVRKQQAITIQKHPNDVDDQDGLNVSLIYIDDLIAALISMIDGRLSGDITEDIVNLGGPDGISIRDLGEQLGEVLGVKTLFEVTDASRDFDLVADIGRLRALVNPTFTPLPKALQETVCSDT